MLKKRITLFGKTIPILVPIVISLVVVAIALAAVIVTVTQTITQVATVKPEPGPAPEIIAAALDLPDVYVGDTFSWVQADPILVTPIEADAWLRLVLDVDTDYTAFEVVLTCTASTGTGCGSLAGSGIITVDETTGSADVQLPAAGTYTFSETVTGEVGSLNAALSTTLVISLDTVTIP